MKKTFITLSILCATCVAIAGDPTKRDTSDMKSAAEFAVKKALMSTGDPVEIGKGLYAVRVTVADKSCEVSVRPDPEGDGPWRWKASALKCQGK